MTQSPNPADSPRNPIGLSDTVEQHERRVKDLIDAVMQLKIAMGAFGPDILIAVEVHDNFRSWLKRECIIGGSIMFSGHGYNTPADKDGWHPEVLGVPFKPGVPKR